MKNNTDITLALFFTYGVSLKEWAEKGLLTREIALYNELAEKINRIYFFTYGDKTDLSYAHLLAKNIIIVPKTHNISNKLYSLLLPIIHRKILKTCDILKTNQMDGAWTAVITKIVFRKKIIVRTGYCWSITLKHLNKRIKYFIARAVENLAYQFADGAIVTSQRDLNYASQKCKITPTLIPNYVETDKFRAIKIKKHKNELCFVGRLSDEKNLDSVILALKNTNITLNLIGDGPAKTRMINLAEANKVNLKLSGIIPHDKLPEILNTFEIFILPSYFEGNPKALLEAMACGLCCIGTNVEGIREIIKNGENGILCETDAESIKTAILNAFENYERIKILGKTARTFVVNNNSLPKTTLKETNLYSSIL